VNADALAQLLVPRTNAPRIILTLEYEGSVRLEFKNMNDQCDAARMSLWLESDNEEGELFRIAHALGERGRAT
jgi:hypothetical protein